MKRRLASALAALCVVVSVWGASPQPSGAVTPNEHFTTRVYWDFLQRPPTSSELTWWSAYLGAPGATRTTMVSSILATDEFKYLWVAGVLYRYLDEFDPTGTAANAPYAALQASGDYLATELDVLGGSAYDALAGGSATGFTNELYQDVFNRAPNSTDQSYWVGRLNAATITRRGMAEYFIRSSEGAGKRVGGSSLATTCAYTALLDPDALSSGSYCIILDRIADSAGRAYWTTQLSGTAQLPLLWSSLAGSTEYFNLAQP